MQRPASLALLLALALAPALKGLGLAPSSSESYPLQLQDPGARASALAGAMVAVSASADSLDSNPAGLAGLDEGGLLLTHNQSFLDTHQEALRLDLPLQPRWGGASLAADFVDYGKLDGRDSSGAATQDFSASEARFQAGWGFPLAEDLGCGMALRMTEMGTLDSQALGLGFGLGGQWLPKPWLCFGASLQGLGGPASDASQAWVSQAGVALAKADIHAGSILGLASLDVRNSQEGDWQAGLEYRLQGWSLRLGYHQAWSQGQALQSSGLPSAGAGLQLGDFSMDYAWVPDPYFDATQRFTLAYRWAAPGKQGLALDPGLLELLLSPPPVEAEPALPSLPPAAAVAGPAAKPARLLEVLSDGAAQAESLAGQGRAAQALACLRQALATDPKDSSAWRVLARLLARQGWPAQARQAWQHLRALLPEDAEASSALGASHPLPPALGAP
jgi:tetratricopeptide (TPR) repeat protein